MRVLLGAEAGGGWLVRVVGDAPGGDGASIVFAWDEDERTFFGGVDDVDGCSVSGTEFGYGEYGAVVFIEDIEAILFSRGFGSVVHEVPELVIAQRGERGRPAA